MTDPVTVYVLRDGKPTPRYLDAGTPGAREGHVYPSIEAYARARSGEDSRPGDGSMTWLRVLLCALSAGVVVGGIVWWVLW